LQKIAVLVLALSTLVPTAVSAAEVMRLSLAERLRDAESPTDQLRRHIDRVLDILRNPSLKPRDQAEEREAEVRKALLTGFDVPEMARRVTTSTAALSPDQRREATQLLTEMLTAAMGRLAIRLMGTSDAVLESRNESTVRYLSESVHEQQGVVHTVVLGKGARDIPVTARMIRRGAGWFVYDLTVAEVSLIESYRAQCDALLRRVSYAGLAERLRNKRDDFVTPAAGRD